jgi:hypothetical protein
MAAAAERERNLASRVPARVTWEAEHRALRERAAELNAELSSRCCQHLRVAVERLAPCVTEAVALCLSSPALGAPGSKPPRASRPIASTTPSQGWNRRQRASVITAGADCTEGIEPEARSGRSRVPGA